MNAYSEKTIQEILDSDTGDSSLLHNLANRGKELERLASETYVLTREHNTYDQFGSYFVAWFSRQPSSDEVKAAIKTDDGSEVDDALASHIVSGGGRQDAENVWWHLKKVSSANNSDEGHAKRVPSGAGLRS